MFLLLHLNTFKMGKLFWYIVILSLQDRGLAKINYPEVRRDESVVDDYFGVKVPDPYRWLEDLDSNETKAFVEQEQKLTQEYLSKCPYKGLIEHRMMELANRTKTNAPIKAGSRYFTFEKQGLQNFYVLYVQDSLRGERREFLNVNKLSNDSSISMDPESLFYDFSKDGSVLAYSVQKNGADWRTIHFRNVSTGTDLPDMLSNTKFPFIEWSMDNQGIFYTQIVRNGKASSPEAPTNTPKVYYHRLGTPQSEDILIAYFPDHPLYYLLESHISDYGRYLIVTVTQTFNANGIYIFPLKDGIDNKLISKIVPIFPNATEAAYRYVGNLGTTFLFQTNRDAPNFKLITANINATFPQPRNLTKPPVTLVSTFLEEHPKNVINFACIMDRDKLLVSYMEDVKHTLELRRLEDASLITKIHLPHGSISGFVRQSVYEKEFFFSLENFVSPGTIYRCILNGIKISCKVFKQLRVPNTKMNSFDIEQIFYPSKDDTLIPMYIMKKKGAVLNGSTPALLYGYGGFNEPILPTFSAKNLAFVDNFNGVFASANIRGGGEYGKQWYDEGSMLNKQTSFDDFQAAAEYLIQKNYTSPAKLTIDGASNGGLLTSACVNQRPDLFGAALVTVGVMDMVRVSKFTIGFIACSEYTCPTSKERFLNLYKYSPLHNIRLPANESVQYPAVLVITADHDDRVPPLHSYKYIAELQHTIGRDPRQVLDANKENPLLLRVEHNSGHGTGMTTWKMISEAVDTFAFLSEALGLDFRVNQK